MTEIETLQLALKEANETIELQRQQILSLDRQLIDVKMPIKESEIQIALWNELDDIYNQSTFTQLMEKFTIKRN